MIDEAFGTHAEESGATEKAQQPVAARESWLDMVSNYVRDNPTIAAAIAFQVGAAAGLLTKTASSAVGRSGAAKRVRRAVAPSVGRLQGAVSPALADIVALFGSEPAKRTRRKPAQPAKPRRRRKAASRKQRAA